jgi:hypothetical protein
MAVVMEEVFLLFNYKEMAISSAAAYGAFSLLILTLHG